MHLSSIDNKTHTKSFHSPLTGIMTSFVKSEQLKPPFKTNSDS